MTKYELWLYEVWGNSKDGYDINNWHKALVSNDGSIFNTSNIQIDIDDNTSDKAINRKLKVRGIEWDCCTAIGDGDINGHSKRNGKPFGFLRPVE